MRRFWNLEGIQEKYKDAVLKIEHRTLRFSKINQAMPFTVVTTRNWGVVVPVTEDGKFILVRQYRVATDEVTLEFPGGAIDKGEGKEAGAIRELEEETGYLAGAISHLGDISPNPAFLNNACYVYLATGCKPGGIRQPDLFEDIEIVTVTRSELMQLVAEGKITHSIALAALALYLSKE